MKFSFNIRGQDIKVNTWNTKVEKEFLIYQESFNSADSITKINNTFNILLDNDDKYIKLTPEDKLYILMCMRTKCVDEYISFTYTCEKCNKNVESVVDANILDGMLYNEGLSEENISYNNFTFTIKNFEIIGFTYDNKYYDTLINKTILDEIDIGTINYINNIIKEKRSTISFKYEGVCPLSDCNHTTEVIFYNNEMLDFMSNETVTSIYRFYVDMKEKANYSTFEIDDMLPMERDITLGILNEIRTNKNKG